MDALERYVHDLSSPEEELLHELDRQTHLRVVQPRMLSGHIQGKLLELLVRMLRPRNILEIGTFTGYSALCMAAGLEEDGVLDTVEVDDELEEFAASFFRRSPHGQKIRQHIGSALDIVPTLGYTFDLVFIDGDKREYPDYYRMLMGDGGSKVLVHSGSILIADNILWSGKIVDRRILFGGEGVELAAEIFEPAVHLVSLAVLRTLEQGVFGEMGQSELVFQLVAASGVHQQGAVRDVAFDPTVNAPDAVGERIGGKFHRCLIRFSRGAPGSDPCNSPYIRPARPEYLRRRCCRPGRPLRGRDPRPSRRT